MAIGLGKMLGFDFLENFRYPYISKSITEFWRRWHLSLGTCFREYVYIPLGGNRKGPGIQLCNIAVVWLLTGIWHGASWNFAFWGLYYCLLLILEKLFLLRLLQRLPAALAHLYTLPLVVLGWVLFAFDALAQCINYLKLLVGWNAPLADDLALFTLGSNWPLLVILIAASTPLPAKVCRNVCRKLPGSAATVVCNSALGGCFLLSVTYLVDGTCNPFLYFRF